MNLQESIRRILREEFNYSDILNEVANHILNQISDFNEDMVTPLKLYVFGSRIKKNHDDDSDLDILFIYDGNLKSKYLQNILNEDLPFGDEINLDIVPTNINEETFLNQFNMDYDVENLPVFYFDRQ